MIQFPLDIRPKGSGSVLVQTGSERSGERAVRQCRFEARAPTMHVRASPRFGTPQVHPDRAARDRDEADEIAFVASLPAADTRPRGYVRRRHD